MTRPHLLGIAAVAAATLACAGAFREGGVCLPNKMDTQARAHVQQKKLVDPGETLLAYYDATITLDGSEIALLTDQRAIYHIDGQTTSLRWSEVTAIDRIEVPLADGFLISGPAGRSMQIEIAAFNGGDVWERVQSRAWEQARSDASSGAGAP